MKIRPNIKELKIQQMTRVRGVLVKYGGEAVAAGKLQEADAFEVALMLVRRKIDRLSSQTSSKNNEVRP